MESSKTILYFSILLFLIISTSVSSQIIKGKVTNPTGETIPFTSIYVQETTFGTTTNNEGLYEIQFPQKGTFHITFQSLGFIKQEFDIEMKAGEQRELNVVMIEQTYSLNEVKVYADDEDPAYRIMRKAISLAPYYLRQTSHYQSEVYIKGSLLMKKMPKFIQKKMEVNGDHVEVGKTYTAESLNKITFDEPDKYNHEVISSRSSLPSDNDNSAMGYINSSFYQPQMDEIISPLAPNAFNHYKFVYEDYFKDGDLYINRIKIIPKRSSQQLVSGYIFIIENYWNIYSVDVKVETFYGPITIKQSYSPVKENVWLPTSHYFDIEAAVFGIKATANYICSVKYLNILVNDKLPVPNMLQAGYDEVKKTAEIERELAQPAKTKNQEKIDRLSMKEDLNNREMIQLARLIEKENSAISKPDTSLEVIDNYQFKKAQKDTLKADTAYWNSARPIPLSADEFRSFEVKDSIKLAKTTAPADSTKTPKKDKSGFSKTLSSISNGKTFNMLDSTVSIKYNGLLKLKNIGFNPVEAVWLKQSINIKIKTDSTHQINIDPMIKYSFGQERFTWETKANYEFAPLKRGNIGFDLGQTTCDFYGHNSTTPIVNLAYNLFLKENYTKLYHQNYLNLYNNIDLTNGLQLHTQVRYAQYEQLQNTTDFSFYNASQPYTSNDPVNDDISNANLSDQNELSYQIGLTYTPKHHYKINKGAKEMLYSKYPTFSLKYSQGLPSVFNSDSKFSMIDATIDQTFKWGTFSEFHYQVNGGAFFNNEQMHFSAFKHFNTLEPIVEMKDMENNFALLNNYQPSTNQWYTQTHLRYTTPYLFLKYLPFFSNRMWLENLYLNQLSTPNFSNHLELGYGISQIFLLAETSVFASFNNTGYEGWGLKVIFHF